MLTREQFEAKIFLVQEAMRARRLFREVSQCLLGMREVSDVFKLDADVPDVLQAVDWFTPLTEFEHGLRTEINHAELRAA